MNIGTIQGGTNAGWRRVKERPKGTWLCAACDHENKAYLTACWECHSPRKESS